MSLTYLVPADTARTREEKIAACENMSLILGRFIPNEVIQNDDVPPPPGRNRSFEKWRSRWMQEVCDLFSTEQRSDWKQILIAQKERWDRRTKDAHSFKMQAQGRLLVGLGADTVLETGLTLQHVTGLPIIPGSALKGLCRSYILFVIAAGLEIPIASSTTLKKLDERAKEEKKPIPSLLTILDDFLCATDEDRKETFEETLIPEIFKQGDEQVSANFKEKPLTLDEFYEGDLGEFAQKFRLIFGSQEEAGLCVFHEGIVSKFSESGYLFDVDVMTPHYRQYYESDGKKPPVDDDSPNPINFITVSAGTTFAFAVGLSPRAIHFKATEGLEKWAADQLKEALNHLGIGAKTATGYGVFVYTGG